MALHRMKIIPGSDKETKFIEELDRIGVNRERILCRHGNLFDTEYDEYLISDGLYKRLHLNNDNGTQA